METIAQEAKRILEEVPEDQWIVGEVSSIEKKCCGWGHLARICSGNPNNYNKSFLMRYSSGISLPSKLIDLVTKFMKSKLEYTHYWIGDVNDGKSTLYKQPTPKQRVMSLLTDMINAGY